MTTTIFQYLDRFGSIINQQTFSFFTAIQYIDYLRTDSTFFSDVPKNAEFIRLVNEDGTVRMYWIYPKYGDSNTWGVRDWEN